MYFPLKSTHKGMDTKPTRIIQFIEGQNLDDHMKHTRASVMCFLSDNSAVCSFKSENAALEKHDPAITVIASLNYDEWCSMLEIMNRINDSFALLASSKQCIIRHNLQTIDCHTFDFDTVFNPPLCSECNIQLQEAKRTVCND
jgi:hypothetical protein